MTEPNNNDRRTLAEWLRDVTGANPDLLGPFYPGDVGSPNERRPDHNSPADPAAPSPTPQDLHKMGRSDEQAEQFHRLLQANSEKPADEGYEELLDLAKTVGWLHTKQCLTALRSVLETLVKRNVQERPVLLEALANQIATFPPQDEDYEEPTDDQVSALEALLHTMSDHLEPDQWPEVLPSLREALGGACGGVDWYMGELSLEDAVAKAKPEKGLGPLLGRLVALTSQAEPAELLSEVVGGEPPSSSKNVGDEDATTGDPSLTPQDLQKMGRSDEQAEQFHRLLRANAGRPVGEGYEELVGLAKTVGWLHTKQCLPALRSVLETVVRRDVQERPALLEALANQLATFPPQDEDYEEPTADQVSALDALLQTATDDLKPEQWSDVHPSLREALGGACGGMDWYMGGLSLENAVAKAKPTQDMSSFLEKLNALAVQAASPENLSEAADDVQGPAPSASAPRE